MTVAVSLFLGMCGAPAFAAGMADVFAQQLRAGRTFEQHPEWRRVMETARPPAPGTAWAGQVAALGNWSRPAQMGHVHSWVNELPYRTDRAAWSRHDYWETPREMLAGSGDCEGFAILKYFSLRALGFAAKDLRIVVLIDRRDRSQHAVLTVRWGGAVWMLDNREWDVIPASRVPYYQPVYSVNEKTWAVHTRLTLRRGAQ